MKAMQLTGMVAVLAAVVFLVGYAVAEDMPGHAMPAKAASAPATMMCDMKTCHEHMATVEQALKSLDAAKMAADKGDAKAAAAEIDKASTILKDMQASMKKMMGQMMGSPATQSAAAKVVNTRCPIMGGKVDPNTVPAELTREHKGQKVGFCCSNCPPAWDKLSDADKDKKLSAAMKP